MSSISKRHHVSELLPAYINGSLGNRDQARVEAHLDRCDACRNELDEWSVISQATQASFTPDVAPPLSDLDRVWAAIDGSSKQRPMARRTHSLSVRQTQEIDTMVAHPYSPKVPLNSMKFMPFSWLVAILVVTMMIGSFAYYSFTGTTGRPEPMPAAQFAGLATPSDADCPDSTSATEFDVTGSPSIAAVIPIPEDPYEGGFHVRPENLPMDGELASKNTVNGISQTVTELTACINEGRAKSAWALTTDDYMRRYKESGRDPARVAARAVVPMVGPVEGETPVPGIRNVIVLGDGRVGAEIHPEAGLPPESYDYYVFVNQDGEWLIDEAVHVQGFAQVEVTVNDEGFSPRELIVPPQSAELVLTNEGEGIHSLYVAELGLRVEAAPGESIATSLKAPTGVYGFESDVPGDEGDGFQGQIVFETDAVYPTPAAMEHADATDSTPVVPDGAYPTVAAPVAGDVVRTTGVPLASATIHANAPESYSPDRVFILADRDVELTLVNDGVIEANFTIDTLGIDVDLAPGETQVIVVNAPQGVHAFYSTIPGHAEVGMSGTLFLKPLPVRP